MNWLKTAETVLPGTYVKSSPSAPDIIANVRHGTVRVRRSWDAEKKSN
jgi:hypothetical protein